MFHFCAQTIQMDCSTVNANAHSMINLLHGIHAKIEAYYKVIIYHKSYIPHTDHFLLLIQFVNTVCITLQHIIWSTHQNNYWFWASTIVYTTPKLISSAKVTKPNPFHDIFQSNNISLVKSAS